MRTKSKFPRYHLKHLVMFVFFVSVAFAFIRYLTRPYYEVVRLRASNGGVSVTVKAASHWELTQPFYCSVILTDDNERLVLNSYMGSSDRENPLEFSVVESHDRTVIGLLERSNPSTILCLVDVKNKYIWTMNKYAWTSDETSLDSERLTKAIKILRNDHNADYTVGWME